MAKITLGGNACNTAGDLPEVGTQAPSFTLTNAKLADFSLSDFAGKNVVLNIFPSIDTGVCSASTRRFNEELQNLDNTVVVCVSKDLPFAFARFCGAEGLDRVVTGSEFRGSSIADGYNVTIVDGGFSGLFSRAVVVIDPSGKVIYTEQVPEIGQAPNFEAALAALK